MRKLNAFTFTEILMVLVIVGILISWALPKFMPKITEAKAQEAKLQLKHLYTLEKTYFMMHSKYSTSFDDVGFEQAKLVSEGGTANYQIEIVDASNNSFKAQATSITDFDGDGVFNRWEIDHEMNMVEVQKD